MELQQGRDGLLDMPLIFPIFSLQLLSLQGRRVYIFVFYG